MKKTSFRGRAKGLSGALIAALSLSAVDLEAQTTVQDLFAISYQTPRLTRINGQTGAVVYSVQSGGYYVAQGPDGLLYAGSRKYNPATGSIVPPPHSIPPYGIDFGSDGKLYAGIQNALGSVRRYDGATGALLGDFVAPGSGGLGPVEAVRFGPDGNLYVTESYGEVTAPSRVLRFNGATGTFMDVFAADARLVATRSFDWGPNGNLFVASLGAARNSGNVVEFNGATGAYVRTFAEGLDLANGLAFGPDGNLYVGLELSGTVKRFNGTTGTFIDDFATGLPPGVVGITWATVIVPEPSTAGLAVGLMVCIAGTGTEVFSFLRCRRLNEAES